MMNIQLTQYAWFKPSRVIGITLSVAILFAPVSSVAQEVCTQQIMYGKNPETGQWEQLPNPCVIPADWTEISPTLPTESASTGGVAGKDTTGSVDTTGNQSPPTTITEVPATGGADTTTPTTTTPTETTEQPTGVTDTSPTDGSADCPAQITYAKPSETSQKWYLFSTPCDVPDGWIKADNEICADVVVYAQNPTSKNWYSFVTPCDVPAEWTEISYTKPENTELNSFPGGCTTDVKYAKNLKTGHWYAFGLSCDAPSGADWQIDTASPQNGVNIINPKINELNQCPSTLTYAQHPNSKHWYAFATPCDVPAGWNQIGVVQPEEKSTGETCEAFYANYANGHLNIPMVKFNNWLFKDIGLLQVGGIEDSYFLFSFDIEPLPMPTETK